jgi:carboxypeptidase C (cathepsin A)
MNDIGSRAFAAGRLSQIGIRTLKLSLLAGVLAMALASGVSSAVEETESPAPVATPKADSTPPPTPRSESTKHQLRLDGQVLHYTPTVGWLILMDDKDKPIARFGYTA